MILTSYDYSAPADLAAALAALAATPGATALAGGQQLLLDLQKDGRTVPALVDLRRVTELSGVSRTGDGGLRVGAATTLARLAQEPAVLADYPALAAAARSCGDPQVRNRATVGGNLSTDAAPTDLPVAAVALGAWVVVSDTRGTRRMDAETYAELVAAGRPADLLVVALELPAPTAGAGGAFEKIPVRATRYPLCAVAATASFAEDGTVLASRIAVTGSVPRPLRLPVLEAALVGTRPTLATIRARVRDLPQETFVARPGVSREYLAHLTAVLTERVLRSAAAA